MQNIPILIVGLFIVFNSYGQAPNGLSFQAVVRNTEGEVISNQQIQVKLSILKGSSSGPILYSELHSPTTNFLGLFSLTIGQGIPITGLFADIDWSTGNLFLKREIDPNNNGLYPITGTTQFLTIPYSFYSNVADSSRIARFSMVADSVIKKQQLSISNDTIYLSGGGFAKLPSITPPILSVSASGDTLYIGGGNYIIVPGITAANYLTFNKTYGGSLPDILFSIEQTIDGGYIVVGFTHSSNGDITDGNNGLRDIWIIKLRSDGLIEWNKTYGGVDSDVAESIKQTSDGGYIVAGRTKSSDGDITDGINGTYDVLILKLNSDGTKVWDKTYGGSIDKIESATATQQTNDGGYIVVGYTASLDGDITDGNNGDHDVLILKLNSDGTKQWDKTYGGSGYDVASATQQTNDGGYIVAGYTTSSDGDITDGYNGGGDIWILKLNSNGTKVWDKTFGGSLNEADTIIDIGPYITSTVDGGFILVGNTNSNDGDITDGNNGDYDVLILKLNSDGTKQWDKTYGGSSNDYAHSIQQTSDGGFIVAGRTESSDGDITDGNNGDYDVLILKLNSDGTKQWDKTYGGSGFDIAKSIRETSDGGYIVAGYTFSSDGDITDGYNGNRDFWILKLNKDGYVY